jgi:hypothetical protein
MNTNSLIHKPEPLRKYLLHELGSINNNCFYLARKTRTPQAIDIMGRKKIPLAQKRINFSVTLSPEAQKIIEKNTKDTTRSAFIEKTIKHFDGRRKTKRI